MMDEIKGHSILGFVICFQNVSIFNYYHLPRSAEKLLQNLCNISEYIYINKLEKLSLGCCPLLQRVAANSTEELTQWKFLQMKKFVKWIFYLIQPLSFTFIYNLISSAQLLFFPFFLLLSFF